MLKLKDERVCSLLKQKVLNDYEYQHAKKVWLNMRYGGRGGEWSDFIKFLSWFIKQRDKMGVSSLVELGVIRIDKKKRFYDRNCKLKLYNDPKAVKKRKRKATISPKVLAFQKLTEEATTILIYKEKGNDKD